MTEKFHHSFPAVRGIQAGRPCYIAMCPMRLIPKIFVFNEDEVPPELRAQRTLNVARVPEIASYLIENPKDYTLSAITASIDAAVQFEPSADTGLGQNIGTLSIPMDAQILINDGQHRRAAIEVAVRDNPEIGYDNIPVLFFIDEGLDRSQQMFADLNKNAVRPSDSISTLYDRRDQAAELARHIVRNVDIFSRLTDFEKSSISNRSSKLFTLSAIKNASKALLRVSKGQIISSEDRAIAVSFWTVVAEQMSDWQMANRKKVATSELREGFIHAHGVMLQALGVVGAELLSRPESEWRTILSGLKDIDWARANPDWEGRAIFHGRISKATTSVVLTAIYIKQKLGMQLTLSDVELEGKISR